MDRGLVCPMVCVGRASRLFLTYSRPTGLLAVEGAMDRVCLHFYLRCWCSLPRCYCTAFLRRHSQHTDNQFIYQRHCFHDAVNAIHAPTPHILSLNAAKHILSNLSHDGHSIILRPLSPTVAMYQLEHIYDTLSRSNPTPLHSVYTINRHCT